LVQEQAVSWRHGVLRVACFDGSLYGKPIYRVDHISRADWSRWAANKHRDSIKKAKSNKANGPHLISCWLAMRAAKRGWEDLFEVWAERAHRDEPPDRETLESDAFEKLSKELALDERMFSARARFHKEYEQAMGYPVSCSDLTRATEEEAVNWADYPFEDEVLE
jgi:hypothetical protein